MSPFVCVESGFTTTVGPLPLLLLVGLYVDAVTPGRQRWLSTARFLRRQMPCQLASSGSQTYVPAPVVQVPAFLEQKLFSPHSPSDDPLVGSHSMHLLTGVAGPNVFYSYVTKQRSKRRTSPFALNEARSWAGCVPEPTAQSTYDWHSP